MYILLISITALLFCSCQKEQENSIDLAGEWNFKIDAEDVGIIKKWHQNKFKETIQLPGSMASNNKGDEVTVNTDWTGNMWNDSLWYTDPKMEKYRIKGNVKIPFWLTPKKVYKGAAWYQKEIIIPENWSNKQFQLHLERVHWESTVWINNKKIGSQNSLATPHNYIFSDELLAGKNTITIRVDNRIRDINVGLDAHSISDNTQTNWNGIIGDIKLLTKPKINIDVVNIRPNITKNKVEVVIKTAGNFKTDEKVTVKLTAKEKFKGKNSLKPVQKAFKINNGELVLEYKMGDNVKLWDEFNPNVYQMEVVLKSSSGIDKQTVDFGMREIKTQDNVFTVNNKPIFLRGTLECAIFPLTGFPPTDVASWKQIYKIIKNHGLNHMRFHSWCPPEAAFAAADEEGIYLQVEASAWLANLGDGTPVDNWLYREGEDIINAYGNHPSFVMMTYGNEPSGKNHKAYLTKYVAHFKKFDNRKLYTSGAGYPYLNNMDFYNHRGPRIQGWNENLKSIINAKPPQTQFDWRKFIDKTPMPYVSHEMGQWCVYPNFKEMSKYTGVLQPKNFEIFKESLEENNLGDLAEQFLLASGKLQTLCYKADIEAALRTKNMAGFQLLDLHDFPGQGTALVGVLDVFWDEKGYVKPEKFKQFSGQTVPLARLEKRAFKNTDTLKATIEIAHFGENALENVIPKWSLKNEDDTVFVDGNLPKINIKIGNGIQLGTINIPLQKINKAQKLTLTINVKNFKNTWDVWVYPTAQKEINNTDFKVVDKLDAKTISYLQNGGNVLLNINKGDIADEKGGKIGIGFSSIFWNTSWTKEQKPHTLGILCDPKHPALADFPTEFHSNWQWWDAMTNSNAIILDDFNKNLKPIVRVIDDWFKNRSTALIFEAKVGKGKILVSGIDLHTNLEKRLEAKQLLYSLKKYMNSNKFVPKIPLKISEIQSLLKS
ncbi:beta-galactosidase [Polaribacter porphyrae]|uniref:beta-galactosidase n=1 Tax=Polaribacter porphyrae TaxID=1137780 RepID=A0A2S7WUH7_9FLAO|nr:beta-galactosidase [Polaribacter porphyrae]